MSILDLDTDCLYSILDMLNWKTILTFSSICTKLNTFHNDILKVLNNDELFKLNAKTMVCRFLVNNNKKLINKCVYWDKHLFVRISDSEQNVPDYTIFMTDDPVEISIHTLCIQTVTYYDEPTTPCQLAKSHNDKHNIINLDGGDIDSIITNAITFDSEMKVHHLYNLLKQTVK